MLSGSLVYSDHHYKMAFTFQLLVLLGLSSGLWMGANASYPAHAKSCLTCPEGWIRSKSHCYLFDAGQKEWHEAESHCISKGGNLASISDQDELNFVKELLVKITGGQRPTWLGGTDAVKESAWRWSDGSQWNFNYWGDGEPNNAGGNEHCMHLRDADGYPVNDAPCNSKQSVLCSREVAEKN